MGPEAFGRAPAEREAAGLGKFGYPGEWSGDPALIGGWSFLRHGWERCGHKREGDHEADAKDLFTTVKP
jgi:hypothetical protein